MVYTVLYSSIHTYICIYMVYIYDIVMQSCNLISLLYVQSTSHHNLHLTPLFTHLTTC